MRPLNPRHDKSDDANGAVDDQTKKDDESMSEKADTPDYIKLSLSLPVALHHPPFSTT